MQDDSFFSPATVQGSLSLDRVTFLLFSPSLSLWTSDDAEYRKNILKLEKMAGYIQTLLKDELDPDFPQGSASELFRYHYRTLDEVDIQFGSQLPKRKKITDEGMLQAFGSVDEQAKGYMYQYNPNYYAFRIEYNPNKASLRSVSSLLENFSHNQSASMIRIARLDIAIDFNASIVPEMVLCEGMRKSFTASGPKGIESVYFGTRKSKNYIRLYDKRQEQLDTLGKDIGYDMWRLELESKESFFLDSPPDHGKVFQRFTFYDGAVASGDWLVDLIRSQAMIYGLQNVLRKMPKNTAIRYRKLFKEGGFKQNVETPSLVYYREFPGAMERLRVDILSACGFEML